MDVVSLSEGKFSVTAHAEQQDGEWVIPLVEFLNELEDKQYGGMVDGLFALFEHFSEVGVHIGKDLCHFVDQGENIYEFIKGDLRVLWFYAKGQRGIVVCSHGFVKKGQKCPAKEKNKAIRLKREFEDGGRLLNFIKEQKAGE